MNGVNERSKPQALTQCRSHPASTGRFVADSHRVIRRIGWDKTKEVIQEFLIESSENLALRRVRRPRQPGSIPDGMRRRHTEPDSAPARSADRGPGGLLNTYRGFLV